MPEPELLRTEHAVVVRAPARTVYDLLADVTLWPAVFGPSLHVEHLERAEGGERFRIWALVGGEVRDWTSRRTLDPARLRIAFAQEHSRPPVAHMSGEWIVRPRADRHTEVTLVHEYATADGAPEAADALADALDRNSRAELAALARVTEQGDRLDELVFSFDDSVEVPGDPADAYAFIDRADRWPALLPHVAAVHLEQPRPGVQTLRMDTVTADGSQHTTESVRLCFPHRRIVYKQRIAPALLHGHSGSWTFLDAGQDGRARVVARHTVALNLPALREVLGPDADTGAARKHVVRLLAANSRTTLSYATGTRTGSRR